MIYKLVGDKTKCQRRRFKDVDILSSLKKWCID